MAGGDNGPLLCLSVAMLYKYFSSIPESMQTVNLMTGIGNGLGISCF